MWWTKAKPARRFLWTEARPPAGLGRSSTSIRAVHLRLPAIAPGVKAFLWAFSLALYLFLFMRATGLWDRATDAILCALVFCAIFLYVRIFGSDLSV